MKSYPAYKESGLAWLGEIPNHWKLNRAKFIFNKMERPVREEDDVITAFRDGEVTLRKNRRTDGFTLSLKEIGYQGIRKGDLVIHEMDGFAGAIGVSDSDGKSTPVYTVCTPRIEASTAYYAYLLRVMAHNGFIQSLAKGIRERSTSFSYNVFKDLELPYFSFPEQQAIADFLDRKTTQIDDLIAKKQRQIDLLHEQRTALINQTVTKGLNLDVPMKDSGVEWLGEIPSHWIPTKIKYLAKEGKTSFIDGDWIESPYITDGGIRLIQTGNIGIGEYKEQGFRYISEETFQELSCTEVFPSDILICRLASPVGRACLAPDLGVRMITAVDNCILKPLKSHDPRFIVYQLSNSRYLAGLYPFEH